MDQYRTRRVETVAGVQQFRALVAGVQAGGADYAAALNSPGFVGITQEAQAFGRGVSCKIAGISTAIAAGPIAVGDYVNIGDNAGRLGSCQADVTAAPGTAMVIHVVGKAITPALALNDEFEVQINEFVVNRAAS